MVILDSDHLSPLVRGSSAGQSLAAKLVACSEAISTTVVTMEEMLRGRLVKVSAARSPAELVAAYARFQDVFVRASGWRVRSFDPAASEMYERLRSRRIKVGTMDLRIAAIVIANGATLLSRNLRDFGRVPELKVEDWLS